MYYGVKIYKRSISTIKRSQRTTKPAIRLKRPAKTDQPTYPHSLIRVFAGRMCLQQPPGHPKRDKLEPLLYLVDEQADLSLCWLHSQHMTKSIQESPEGPNSFT